MCGELVSFPRLQGVGENLHIFLVLWGEEIRAFREKMPR
ncbi:hypothetical protein T4C_8705 [Trichinella pseudospiralis]|uniref:Uncharacterized protein n=1 Tax=Trichinella pseudospiralis TaxID=6337 RepID=A0A0V1GF93_TRIPS|nr:hypothetical protein T4C_8705 [Trichinella pseudospiralis]